MCVNIQLFVTAHIVQVGQLAVEVSTLVAALLEGTTLGMASTQQRSRHSRGAEMHLMVAVPMSVEVLRNFTSTIVVADSWGSHYKSEIYCRICCHV